MSKISKQASKSSSELTAKKPNESVRRREWSELSWEEMNFPTKNRLPANEITENMSTSSVLMNNVKVKNSSMSREAIQEAIEQEIKALRAELGNEENESDPNNQEEWSVERIRNKKLENGIVAYEAKWEDFPDSSNTTENLEHLDNSLILVKSFENSHFIVQNARCQEDQKVLAYKDKKTAHDSEVWRKLVHLIEPEDILAIDFTTRKLLVSFKNIGEVALVDVNEFIVSYEFFFQLFTCLTFEIFFSNCITER